MSLHQPILVFGATGQQGGSVAAALLKAGHSVRAIVRDLSSPGALALRDAGAELVEGSFDDKASMEQAMQDVQGVFSVQPSSPGGTVTDEEEVRYGIVVADLAAEAGVQHLVYSSGAAVGDKPTGVAHFDTKMRIEAHVRALPITWTIVRPAIFMEMLVMPGFGLDEDRFTFFARPDQSMQFIAVEDIGRIVATVFAAPKRFGGQTFEIAGDQLTGRELETLFSREAGRPIAYARFSDDVLAANPFLAKLTRLLDEGPVAGHADLDALRAIEPGLTRFSTWLAGSGREPFARALGAKGAWAYNSA
ncbi:NmrA/HSCARG family protein [Aureimonas mangrovi]|uniref:NmrA/HSCARG family protein n=1 Tax=Aureimonas mangrovi TaxID=2758041 RepID=UPI00163D7339|nr:NmrA/HSCARG family protein [Aureimonas mangrovi]